MKIRYFIDTSALFKRYVLEKGSSIMDHVFSQDAKCYISSLSLVEAVANLRRLVEVDQVISEEDFRQVLGALFADIKTGAMELIEVKMPAVLRSVDLCVEGYMSPIDALQLAVILESPDDFVFVCSDKGLLRRAREKGVTTLNPEDGVF
jgi:predicted nucleic acid-binding protein